MCNDHPGNSYDLANVYKKIIQVTVFRTCKHVQTHHPGNSLIMPLNVQTEHPGVIFIFQCTVCLTYRNVYCAK